MTTQQPKTKPSRADVQDFNDKFSNFVKTLNPSQLEILGNLTSKGKSEPPDVQGYDTYDYASADVWYGGQEYKVWAIYDEDTGQYAYGYYEEG